MDADVLVLGGGPAATWAAVSAARQGAAVVLADKGYCGTSGVAATAGVGHWFVPPEPAAREQAIAQREAIAGGLAERRWMTRILDQTWETLPTLSEVYPFPADEDGAVQYRRVRGPEYMRAIRRLVRKAGVTIMDHGPALELLVHDDGSVAGAAGDAASREIVAGASSGGGAQNSSWAMSTRSPSGRTGAQEAHRGRWRRDRSGERGEMRDLRHLRARLPDQRGRRRAGRRAADRPPGGLPDRRDSGWGKWHRDPALRDQSWPMDSIFAEARSRAARPAGQGRPVGEPPVSRRPDAWPPVP